MKRFIVWITLVASSLPLTAVAPKWEWPMGFSLGGGVAYQYAQQENTGASNVTLINYWKNNGLGFSGFLDMTFFMVRTDLQLGVGGEFGGQKFSYHTYGISAYAKFPHVFRDCKIWFYFPMIGVEWSTAFGDDFTAVNPRSLYEDLYVMFGLSGDFEVVQEDVLIKPSFMFGFNPLTYVPGTRTGAGWKVVLGVEMGWRFATFNKFRQ